jgi:hypothetical protein
MPLPHRHDYAAGIHRGLPTGDIEPAQEFPATIDGYAQQPSPNPPG